MRIAADFEVKSIPITYRMITLSVIKECLKQSDEHYFKGLYEDKKKQIKPFSHSVYLNNFEIKNDTIFLDSFTLIISSPCHEFMFHLYNGLVKKRTFNYQDLQLKRKSIRMLNEKDIDSTQAIFKTLSPLLIEDKSGNPVSPDEPKKYEEEFNYYANLTLKSYRGEGLKTALKVVPIFMDKQVVKERIKNNNLFFTTYKGNLALKGDIEDLQLIYQLGVSRRSNLGFGLLELESVVV
ncbi:CRISPR-associated endoribonuclease Cas6 [Natranaerofaba carboxydovora]|uniref:CRISPR-associated endoribonuclease Cas6 n=1 Tax=Natranaerofaba carboxydovora TaxID=2742683 RepID=UPI001F141399|nr:CRISPR-associated endoribonuclease Cas6 [Natranaerofaba carboxydovora]UMZ73546.1 CRISPR associated protein Cas6 [Natranaerofaba carboxydovora]